MLRAGSNFSPACLFLFFLLLIYVDRLNFVQASMALSTSAYSASFADPSRPEIKKSFMVATLFSFITEFSLDRTHQKRVFLCFQDIARRRHYWSLRRYAGNRGLILDIIFVDNQSRPQLSWSQVGIWKRNEYLYRTFKSSTV